MLVQAESGICAVTGTPDEACKVGVSIAEPLRFHGLGNQIERFARALRPGGFLVLGRTEVFAVWQLAKMPLISGAHRN